MKYAALFAVVIFAAAACTERPTLIPNSDPNLRKTSSQFAADAAKRHPFKAELPRGGQAAARAEVDYMLNQVEVANLSQQDWENVELWVNRKYVVFVAKMEHQKLKSLPFTMIFDGQGNYIPTMSLKEKLTKLEAIMDGKAYDIPLKLAD